ncbi:MFS transporter [Streptomyces sp. NPDC126514]|uniref:MFS transporter n=1 Tax=Streptomyces sp. NPDC126514 TaxID=3155210 RepID=UPI00332AFBD0
MTETAPSGTRPPITAALALFSAGFLAMLDLSISMVALSPIRSDLHASLSALQWTVDAYTLCFAGLLLVGGLISDRLGHRTGLIVSLALFTAGSAVCMAAPATSVLIGGRAAQGAAAAILVPTSMALIVRLYPEPKQTARMLGLWSALSGIAIAFGPVLGGLLVKLVSWRAVFAINLPLGLIAILFAVVSVPKARRRVAAPVDVLGVVLGITWAFTLAFGVIEGAVHGWASPLIVGSFVTACLALAAFLLVERRREHAMLPLGLFRSPRFSAASVVAFALGFSLSTAFYFLSLYYQQVLGYSPLQTGIGFLPAALAITVAAPLAGQLAGKYGARPVTTSGLAIGAAGLFSMAFVGPDTPFTMVAWMLVLIGTGLGLALPPNNHTALNAAPSERAGAASGTVETLMQFGTVVGIAVLGAVHASLFKDNLQERLTSQGVDPSAAGQAVQAVASGEQATVPGQPLPALLHSVTAAFSHGLQWVWVVAAAVALLSALVPLLIRRQPDPSTSAVPAGQVGS